MAGLDFEANAIGDYYDRSRPSDFRSTDQLFSIPVHAKLRYFYGVPEGTLYTNALISRAGRYDENAMFLFACTTYFPQHSFCND